MDNLHDIDPVRRSDFKFEYQDAEGNMKEYPVMGQGPAVPADEYDKMRDDLGFTNPNLHRRIEPQDPPKADDPLNQEVQPRDYSLNLQNVHSYRTTTINVHDEDSIYDETP